MKKLILSWHEFMRTIHIPEQIDHDPEEMQRFINNLWSIAGRSKPRKASDNGGYNGIRRD